MNNAIFHCNIKVTDGKRVVDIENVIYKETDGFYSRKRILDKHKLPERVKVLSYDIIKVVGYAED